MRRRAAAITRNFFIATGNFQARVQCFLKLPCFLPQKQEVSGAVATETTMFQGERVVGLACCLEVCKTSRLFRKENEHTACAVPAGTNFLRSGKFQKDLILLELAVIAASCFEVCKTSRFSAKRTACHFLHCAKSNIKSTRDSVLRPRFKALSEKILAEFSGNTSRPRLFAQNGGEKALNRCEVLALQRADLERR